MPSHLSYEFTLCIWHTLKAQPSHNTIRRHGFVVLNEVDTMPEYGRYLFTFGLPLREALEEIAARVFEDAGLND